MSISTPAGYVAQSDSTLAGYLAGLPAIRARLGGDPAEWKVREVGDGNLNLVFLVDGPVGDVCVKQALPYVRLVGEGWPLKLIRAWFEHQALLLANQAAPSRIPLPLHYDEELYLLVMEKLSPHIIMRKGMIEAQVYPYFVEHITDYLARTLFATSDLALHAEQKKALIARFCGNTELCKITEDLIFTDPYMRHERNRWTSPELDSDAARIRDDDELKLAVSFLKLRFMSDAQALLHGDMHTGSIMVTETDTRVIDPEFAFVGPIGFDVGKLIGNLLMSWFSQPGHERAPGERAEYRSWILGCVEGVWNGFSKKFMAQWRQQRTGDAFPVSLVPTDSPAFEKVQKQYIRQIFEDALGNAGCAMIRRTLGLAHNADMETIEDRKIRAACERANLRLATELVKIRNGFPDIASVTARAVTIGAAI